MVNDCTIFVDTENEIVFELECIYEPIGNVLMFKKEGARYSLIIDNVIDTFEILHSKARQKRIIYITKKIIPQHQNEQIF